MPMQKDGKFLIKNNKNVKGISKEALELRMQYKWPGNIRELGSMIERMIALTSNDYIQADGFILYGPGYS